MFQRLRALEDARQRVVIRSRNGIELVIVATGTADGLCEEGAADRVDLFIDHIHHQLLLVLLFQIRVAHRQECGGDDLPSPFLGITGGHQIAGNLLHHEAIQRQIAVEGFDDVIAIAPGITQHKSAQRQRLGIAGDIEPVPTPALAKVRRSEKTIDKFFVSINGLVIDERIDLRRRRRQTNEIKINTANQRDAIGITRRF